MAFHFDAQSTIYFLTFRGTVFRRIIWIVIPYLIYVCGITVIHFHLQKLNVFNNIVGVLGIIISLLLGFRANNSISRYNEGRAAFASMKRIVRSMAHAVWTQVPVHTAQDLVEKKTIINYLDGFCYALKHYLREEYSYEEADMHSRTRFLPQFCGRPKALPSRRILDMHDRHIAREFKPPTNIPQEIIYNLTIYSKYALNKHSDINAMLWIVMFESGIAGLESTLSNLESLQRTPMPVCYASHLSQSFWIYLLALPFQVLGTFGWWTVPIVGFGFFFFIGVMSISLELEDPFGYDNNDLPLDDYCCAIRNELHLFTADMEGDSETWMISPENFPLSPHSSVNAAEWANQSMEAAEKLIYDIKIKPREFKSRKDWKPKEMTGALSPVPKNEGVDNVAVNVADENV